MLNVNMSSKTVPYIIEVENFKTYQCPFYPLIENKEKCKLWLKTMLHYIKTHLKPERVIVIYARYNRLRLERDLCEILKFSPDGKLLDKYEQLC